MSYYDANELKSLGFKSVGENVKLSKNSVFYNRERISIGNNVRIDDFCTVSACENGFVDIGDFVHIASYCYIEAPAGIQFDDFSGLAARCTIYGGSDDYGGEFLTNPCVPFEYRSCKASKIYIGKHAVVGTCSVILPGAELGNGCAIGSMSLVNGRIPEFKIALGIPAKVLKTRDSNLLLLEAKLKKNITTSGA